MLIYVYCISLQTKDFYPTRIRLEECVSKDAGGVDNVGRARWKRIATSVTTVSAKMCLNKPVCTENVYTWDPSPSLTQGSPRRSFHSVSGLWSIPHPLMFPDPLRSRWPPCFQITMDLQKHWCQITLCLLPPCLFHLDYHQDQQHRLNRNSSHQLVWHQIFLAACVNTRVRIRLCLYQGQWTTISHHWYQVSPIIH